jgi:predicted transcriptional regulator
MSYDTLVKQVKTLPEACIEQVSKYIDYVLFQYNLDNMNMEPLKETDEEFNANMQKGLEDAKAGRVQPLDEAFAEIRRQFA